MEGADAALILVPRPAELVKQVISAAESAGVQLLAENALEGGIYNAEALQRMLKNSKHFQRCALLHDVFCVQAAWFCINPRTPY